MTHSYEDIIRLDSERTQGEWVRGEKTLTTHQGCTGSWWNLESLYADPEGKGNTHWQFCFVRDEANAQYIAAMPDAVQMLKLYKQLLDRAIMGLERVTLCSNGQHAAMTADETLADIRKQLDGDGNAVD